MSTILDIWFNQECVGQLQHDPSNNQFAFAYTLGWQRSRNSFALSPKIPLIPNAATASAESHSAQVRQFFENLLPEGDALDDVAQINRISKSNLVGLMLALGKETTGALQITHHSDEPGPTDPKTIFREITREELSQRISDRLQIPFSQWDGRVRLSIAGYQDKIAVYKKDNQWFLVEGAQFASTYIVKPVPRSASLASLPANEFFCMKLASLVGLDVAEVELIYVPQPILFVKRFDREDCTDHVKRLHIIDGCQALGLSVAMKYERPYGDSRDVKDIRDGASYRKLFNLIKQCARPAKDRLSLLRWALFQVLIGNYDAHGKNISFYMNQNGLNLAPAYDLVCLPALDDQVLSTSYGMAIGDAFTELEITQENWGAFADDCEVHLRLVVKILIELSQNILQVLPQVATISRAQEISEKVISDITHVISSTCLRQLALAQEIKKTL